MRVGAAQPVIAAQFDNGGVRLVRQHPIQTGARAGGGVSGHAAIQDLHVAPVRAQGGEQLRLERVGLRQPYPALSESPNTKSLTVRAWLAAGKSSKSSAAAIALPRIRPY